MDNATKKGLLFVLVGPGGSGKNAIMRRILDEMDDIRQLATATTRPKRDNERHGREHLFVSHEAFRRMIDEGLLLEHQEVTLGQFYGIPRASVEDPLAAGEDLIADIEVLGARILRETYGEQVVLVFISVPGETLDDKLDVLRERMSSEERREREQLIEERLERARVLEFPFEPEADTTVVNDVLDEAVVAMKQVIMSQREKNLSRDVLE